MINKKEVSMMRRRGQSTTEYAILLAVVIAVITFVVRGSLKQNLQGALQKASDRIATEAGKL